MRALIVGLVVAGALVACSSSTDVTAALKQSLDRNQSQWEQRSFANYRYSLVVFDGSFENSVLITVNGTTVVNVVDIGGNPVTDDYQYPTVDDLFAIAQGAFGQRNTRLEMDFNHQYGYPKTLVVTRNSAVPPYSATASNLTPLP